jgi:transposase InsO family protein
MAESFVGTLKAELVAGRVFPTRFACELAVVEYLGWFNHTRLHENLGDVRGCPIFCVGGVGASPEGGLRSGS